MASLNKVQLIGNLAADPESRSFQNGGGVVNLRLATSESWKDKSGVRQEKTEWHTVAIFNEGLGKVATSYLRKGSKVYIEGTLQTRKWQDQSGNDRYSTEVVVPKFGGGLVLLDSKRDADGSRGAPIQRDQPGRGFDAGLDDSVPFASCDPALERRVS